MLGYPNKWRFFVDVLTPSLEDYLEAIWTRILAKKVARVKDIAKHLGVSTPSVVNALNSLAEKDLIKHERYGYIELTTQGAAKAREVEEKHNLLFYLLHEIMGVDIEVASQDACKIEHHLSKETKMKIEQMIEFFKKSPEEKKSFTSKIRQFSEKKESDTKKEKEGKEADSLSDLKPGEKGKVFRITGKGDLKKRLLDMGLVPGTEVQLEKVAPLGDPVEVLVKGYRLSLRKDEAKEILLARE